MKDQPKNILKTFKRLLGYVGRNYKKHLFLVGICIIISSLASVAGALFLQRLIDNFITPLLVEVNPVFTGLLRAIGILGAIYVAGILSTYIYNRTMAIVSQGVLRDIRNAMFSKMQTFPIKYFDTNTHGDIMSHYTNDTDTLMDMISRSLPQFLVSIISIIAVIISMFSINWQLTILTLFFIFITTNITKKIALMSSKYFVNQQSSLAKINGYIEEMITGQKVVKVFCHEEDAINDFNNLNDDLYSNMYKAEKFANILMPIANNLGNIQYVLIAIIGGVFAINGVGALTIGKIAAFMQLVKNISMPINQIMHQLSSVIMALAGADRIFKLIDEEPEVDNRICYAC